jgi:L-ascorbate metabolism protein UlaG (beta-lactamase superfamily)
VQLHWFVPSGIDAWLLTNVEGVESENVHGMEWWDEVEHPDNKAKVQQN